MSKTGETPRMATDALPENDDSWPRPMGRKVAVMAAASLGELGEVELVVVPEGRHSVYNPGSAEPAPKQFDGGTISHTARPYQTDAFTI